MKKGLAKNVKALTFIGVTLLILLYVFDSAINLNPLYPESAFFWAVVVTIYVILWSLFKIGPNFKNFVPTPDEYGRIKLNLDGISIKKLPKNAKLFIAIPWIAFFVLSIGSSVIFNANAYRDQLGAPQVQTFTSDLQPVDLAQLPIVDKFLALKLADKKLGEKPSLGSQVALGEPTIQQVNGKLLWAVPLHHSGFFKWITNLQGSAGYITVSATNVNDVQYVENFKIKYQPNSYLLHDLGRWTRFTAVPFQGITDYSFELDDSGVPHWIVTTYKNKRGFALPEATGIVAVNATTGKSDKYTIDQVPEWVDRVQPEFFILSQIDNQGEYVHGFLNFSDKDKFRASEGRAIVYNNNRCYLFTGLTSVGSDESSIGFMMVDMVTKQPLLYQMNGATEKAAQSSAQGKVQHLGYNASFPLIINADGNPTYFMTLKDKEGLIKQYAMVSVQNYSVVGVGETISQAYRNYQSTLRQQGNGDSLSASEGEAKEVKGTVARIASQIENQQTVYFIILESDPSNIFVLESNLSAELALTQPGDSISIKYYDKTSDSPVIQCTEFDNLEFTQQ